MSEYKKPQSFNELVERYGKPWESEEAKNQFEQRFMALWRKDVLEKTAGITLDMPFNRIYCNRDLLPFLDRAFVLLFDRGLLQELKTFDGCWCIRQIRGRTDAWSIHSFGMACDFNALENPLGGPVKFSDAFLGTMEDAGFSIGAKFSRIDAMHFQAADGC